MESSGEGGKKTGEQPESVRREKSEAFSRHRGDDRVAGQYVVVMPPAPPLQGSSETKNVAATFPPTTKSREALELEIQKKKKVIGTIKLNTLPDGGRRLKDQLKELEDQLSLLCLTATSDASTKGISAKNTSAAAEHVSRGEERSGMAFERAVQQADTKAELPAPTAKELKKSAPTERGAGKLDTFKDSQPYKNSQTKHSADAHHASLSASRGNDKKPSDRSSEDVGKSNALPKSPEMQRPPNSRDYRAQSSSPKHLPKEGDLSSSKCESSSQCPTGDVSTKGILISPSESAAEGPGLGDSVVAKRRPVSPVARVGVCQEDPRPPTSALHSVYDRRVLLTSPLPLSKVAVSSAAVKKGATSETLGTRISRGLSEQCTARLQPLIQSLSSQPDEWDESPQPQGVRTALMAHQRQALRWMLWREEQEAPGGILADAMGLGKTLTMLSLVEQQRSRDKAHKLAAKIKSNDKTDGKNDSETAAPAPPRGGTLVVCPLSLLHQWEEEVQRHLPGQWQLHVHHGRNRTADSEELARCDLVVTTYDTISSDWARVDATGKSGLSPLFTVKWRRLVLDEAHNIRNLHTRRAKAACALLAWSRWALTGTPVHNDLNDMRSLLKFLQCHPFDDDSFWKQWVKENPGPEALAVVMKCVLLRRTKEQMGKDGKPLVPLPQKSIILHKLSLEGTEAKVYKELDEWSRSSGPEKYRDPVTGRELYRNTGSRRFVMLIRLQQACSHPALLKKKVLEDAAIDTDELLSAGMAGLQLSDDLAANEDSLDALNLDKYASAQEFDVAYVSCKIKTLLDMLLKVREESNNQDKSVVVSRWTSLLSLVRHHLDRRGISSVTIQGSVPGHQRASYVAKFNDQREGPTVMLLSLEAGGVGLNLVGGNHMFVLDVHWNPALEAQAFDRIHRVGQTKTVVINRGAILMKTDADFLTTTACLVSFLNTYARLKQEEVLREAAYLFVAPCGDTRKLSIANWARTLFVLSTIFKFFTLKAHGRNFFFTLICADTIEERILELQKHKQQLAESVVARRRLTANDYDFLFAKVS